MKKSFQIIFAVLLLLIVARIALPFVGKWYINKTLATGVGGYTGSISDLEVSLMTGSYTMEQLILEKRENKDFPPFLQLPRITFRIFWRPIFSGHLRGKVSLYDGRINFAHNDKTGDSQTGVDSSGLLPTASALFPLTIEAIDFHNMALVFHNSNIGPQKEFAIHHLEGAINNLTNAAGRSDALASDFNLQGRIMETGAVDLKSRFDVRTSPTAFDLNAVAQLPKVTELNPILKYYTGLDVNSGKFDLVIETAGTDRCLEGYVKPVFENLDIFDMDEKFDGLMNFVGEALAGTVNGIVRNYRKDRTATRISFGVERDQFKVNRWEAVLNLFKNAFVEAIKPENENAINVSSRGRSGCGPERSAELEKPKWKPKLKTPREARENPSSPTAPEAVKLND